MPDTRSRSVAWVSGCLVFLFFSLTLPAQMGSMLIDADPFWHIAAGDWMRSHHAIAATDPWSFTAGNLPWLNLSWAWEWLFSYAHQQLGWYGALALHVMVMALGLALLNAACFVVSGDVLAALLTVLAVSFMCSPDFRPLQVTQALLALWVLLLAAVLRSRISRYWLALLPMSTVLWVNVHGGFLAGFLVLGASFLQALQLKRYALARGLAYAGVASVGALFLSPFGGGFLEAVLRPLDGVSRHHISEWMTFTPSMLNLVLSFYGVLFVALVRRCPAGIFPAEFWLSWVLLVLGLTCQRHLPVFAFVSAPVFASRLHEILTPRQTVAAAAQKRAQAAVRFFTGKPMLAMASLACLAVCLWLPGASAARMYGQEHIGELQLTPEIAFIETHYPKLHILNDFSLGGFLIYEAGGRIAVFMDGRTETAYPLDVITDYFAFDEAKPGWEAILTKYDIGGILIHKGNSALNWLNGDRFASRKGWVKAFDGPHAVLFVREGFAP